MKITVSWMAILAAGVISAGVYEGCASLSPGADPLVVRCEQAETTANSTFTLTLTVDNNDRGFWRTNAPAFHSFCEWLRQPVALPAGSITNSLPRNLAMIEQLDQVKLAYKSASISSNTVYTVLTTLLSAESQASAWLTITTNGVKFIGASSETPQPTIVISPQDWPPAWWTSNDGHTTFL